MRRIISIVILCSMIIAVFAGCGVLQKLGLKNNDELTPASSVVMGEEEAKKLSDKVPVHLYFANGDNSKLRLEIRYIPLSEAKKSPGSLASTIIQELIAGPGEKSALKPTIPAGTQLRSPVKIDAGVATVDLSKEFMEKHPGGKAAETMTLFSIVNSLTEMKEIQKVRFLVNGKAQKEFKGNYQFDAPFPRSPALISKEAAAPAPANVKAPAGKETTKAAPTVEQKKPAATTKAPAAPADTKKPAAPTDTKKSGDAKTQETSGNPDEGAIDTDADVIDLEEELLE